MFKHFGKAALVLLVVVFLLALDSGTSSKNIYLDEIKEEASWNVTEYIEAEVLRRALIKEYGNDDVYWLLYDEIITTPEIVDKVLDECSFER